MCTALCQRDFSSFYLWMTFYQDVYLLLLYCNVLWLEWMCDECTWHHKTFLVQSVYWHLAIKLYCIVLCIVYCIVLYCKRIQEITGKSRMVVPDTRHWLSESQRGGNEVEWTGNAVAVVVIVVDSFYITLFSALEQTHCARTWFYMSDQRFKCTSLKDRICSSDRTYKAFFLSFSCFLFI